MARYMRTDLGRGHSALKPPAVVGPGVYYRGILVNLAAGKRGEVVDVTRRRAAHSELRPPAKVGAGISFQGPGTLLTYSRRGTPRSRLQPPTVVFPMVLYFGPQTTFVPSPTQARAAHPRFVYPAVVAQEPAFGQPAVQLAPQPKPRTRSFYIRPTVEGEAAAEIYYGPAATLAYSRRGQAKPRLEPPAQADSFQGPTVWLTRNTPPPTTARLSQPTVVTAAGVFFGPQTSLTRITPAPTGAKLAPPAVVSPVLFFGPGTTLAPQRRGAPKPFLNPPVVVNTPPAILYGVKVTLAYSRRGKPKSKLRPPAVVGAGRAFFGPGTLLTRPRRGRPLSKLRPPAVVGQRPFRGIQVYLAVPKRGRAHYVTSTQSFLRSPPVIGRTPFRGLLITLVRVPGRSTLSLLKPPTVVEEPPVAEGELRIGGRRPNYRYPGQYDEEFEDLLALILASFYDSEEED